MERKGRSEQEEEIYGLLLRLQGGEEAAFEQLLARFRPLILAMASKFCQDSRSAEWDEVCHEAVIALYRAACTYQAGHHSTFGLYARVCIRNALIDRARRMPEDVSLSAEQVEALLFPQSQVDPSDLLVRKEEGQMLYRKVASVLSPFELQVFDGMLEGLRTPQIAKNLGVGEKAVSNAIFRLTEKLRNALR